MGVLALTGGALTSVVIEEIIPEAHSGDDPDPRMATMALVTGFGLFALISGYFGA